jgi:hypothetical protein
MNPLPPEKPEMMRYRRSLELCSHLLTNRMVPGGGINLSSPSSKATLNCF